MDNTNMSDSQFMRFQKKKLEKMERYVDNFDKENRIRMLKKRFESNKNKPKTLLEKITYLFKGK
jgi:hypothetical protein